MQKTKNDQREPRDKGYDVDYLQPVTPVCQLPVPCIGIVCV